MYIGAGKMQNLHRFGCLDFFLRLRKMKIRTIQKESGQLAGMLPQVEGTMQVLCSYCIHSSLCHSCVRVQL